MTLKHVYRKFTNHINAIQDLLEKDSIFCEICDDYEEICSWLDNYCRSKGRPSTECDHARDVMGDLEDEIKKVLSDAGYNVP